MGALTFLTSGTVPAHSHLQGAHASTRPPPALTDAPAWGCSGGHWPGLGRDCQNSSFAELRLEQQEREMLLGQDWFVVVPPLQCPWQTCSWSGSWQDLLSCTPGLRAEWSEPELRAERGRGLELTVQLSAHTCSAGKWAVCPCAGVWGGRSSAPAHCSSLWLLLLLLQGCYGAFAQGSHQLCLQTEEFLFAEKVMAKTFWTSSRSFHYCKNYEYHCFSEWNSSVKENRK